MSVFCKGELVWNTSLTWTDNSWPELTSCFHNTLLEIVPIFFFLVMVPFYLYHLLASPLRKHPISCIFLSKILCIFILGIVDMISLTSRMHTGLTNETVLVQVMRLTILGIILSIVTRERTRGVVRSMPMFSFWLLSSLCLTIKLYQTIMKGELDYKFSKIALMSFRLSAKFSLFLLYCFSDPLDGRYRLQNPEQTAAAVSWLTFYWIEPFIRASRYQVIDNNDMKELHRKDTIPVATRRLLKNFDRQMLGTALLRKLRPRKTSEEKDFREVFDKSSRDDRRATVDSICEANEHKTKPAKPKSLFRALLLTFWWDLLLCNIGMLVFVVMQLLTPIILGCLIDFCTDLKEPKWHGFILLILLMVVRVLGSVFNLSAQFLSSRLAIRVRSATMGAIYQKSLMLSMESMKQFSLGDIVDMMSRDTARLEMFVNNAYWLWVSAALFLGGILMVYNYIGFAMFAGLAVISNILTISVLVTHKMVQFQQCMMKTKDKRLKLINEIVNTIRTIKLLALEPLFFSRVNSIREKEVKILTKHALLDSLDTFCYTAATFWITFLTLVTFLVIEDSHYISTKTAFVTVNYINLIRIAMTSIPLNIKYFIKMWSSVHRINTFLQSDNIEINNLNKIVDGELDVKIEDASFSWSASGEALLKNITLKIQPGTLVAVIGEVGCGKSSLLSAIMGEMNTLAGTVNVNSNMAYAPQQAWIQNTTIRENITFGRVFESKSYNNILKACALMDEIDALKSRDMTDIREKGVNLSGGQKQRISLARAVYSQADIYLFDDPLGAVDSLVGQHIFQNVISNTGLLNRKTRILVTNQIHWLTKVDTVVLMTDGQIQFTGSFEELKSQNAEFIRAAKQFSFSSTVDIIPLKKGSTLVQKQRDSISTDRMSYSVFELTFDALKRMRENWPAKSTKQKTYKPEKKRWEVYLELAKAAGAPSVSMAAFFVLGFHITYNLAYLQLAMWSGDHQLANLSELPVGSEGRTNLNQLYVQSYVIWGFMQSIFCVIYSGLLQYAHVTASRKIHTKLLDAVLKAPMSTFSENPVEQLLNLFGQDLNIVDCELFLNLEVFIEHTMFTLGILVVTSYTSPVFLTALITSIFLFLCIQHLYVETICQLRSLASRNFSQICAHISETLSGLTVIRASKQQVRFIQDFNKKVDVFQKPMMTMFACSKWLQARMELISYLLIISVAVMAILDRDVASPNLISLAITFIIMISNELTLMARMLCELETNIVSAERIQEYSKIVQEGPWTVKDDSTFVDVWPHSGMIEFNNYCEKYRKGCGIALQNINVVIQPGEKVGIVGRTGAGKSAMVLALFRLTEGSTGQVKIDGVDIKNVGLHTLRNRLNILTQDPVLFAGSLRMNLDPYNEKTDGDLWYSLELANLKDFVSKLPHELDYLVEEGGENLSMGQRQLVCLARALLRKRKILIFDEATSAADIGTYNLVQKTIETAFSDCTVITVAHRIHTVLNYDKVIVMERGRVVEFDSPKTLLKNTNSKFYSITHEGAKQQQQM
ncbi:multidrug resistance-associated protein 1-like [Physella acuta]|uniref:multidrug resistance-associated protein 1-like n=1 Tax=Physella acuta TaxID=109671 RepID=UPI0027DC705D|nr:multidrug resistance-associated protein 1-like [Physella acuta]